MKVSIIVPTCTVHPQDVISPRSNLNVIYSDEGSFSTDRSSRSSEGYTTDGYTDHSRDDTLQSRDEYPDTYRSQSNFDDTDNRDYFYDTDITSADDYDTDDTRENDYRDSSHSRTMTRGPYAIGDRKEPFSPIPPNENNHCAEQATRKYISGISGLEPQGEEHNKNNKYKFSQPQNNHDFELQKIKARNANELESHQRGSQKVTCSNQTQRPEQQHSSSEVSGNIAAADPKPASLDSSSNGQSAFSNDNIYQRLVIGTPAALSATPTDPKAPLQAVSFQSAESNSDRQALYGVSNGKQGRSSLPSYIQEVHRENEEEDSTTDDRCGTENQATFHSLKKIVPASRYRKSENRIIATRARVAFPEGAREKKVESLGCAAQGMEKDFPSMIESLGIILLGCGPRHNAEEEDSDECENPEEEEPPITRLSAELRKQRLRNQVLTHERDIAKQKSSKLDQRLESREAEVNDLKSQVEKLEHAKEEVLIERRRRDIKLADILNDLLF